MIPLTQTPQISIIGLKAFIATVYVMPQVKIIVQKHS